MNTSTEKRGIIYVRVSSAEQVDNTSLESQERNCREYANREGIEVLKVFIERGESAKTADRTEFNKAIVFCSAKKIKVDYFIVYKVDRFARNQDDHAMVRATLKKYGTELRSATEAINETSTGRLMEGIMATFAEFDNNVRTERSKGGMLENLKKGIWQWQAPLGYYRPHQGSNIAPEASTAPFIVMLFEEYAKGTYTFLSLAEYVNERGFPTKAGKPLCMQMVEKILKNPLYAGKITTWDLDIKGDFEAIVSEELFMRCQKGYKKTYVKMNRSVQNPNFPLRRACICLECRKSLTGSTTKKGKYSYYHHHKQDCAKAKFIPKETFEQLFVEYLNELTPSGKYEKMFKAIVLDIWENNYKQLNQNNERVRAELGKLEQERLKVFEIHRTGKYSDAEFLEQKNYLNDKIQQKQQLIQDNYIEEFNMEEALSHCFTFVRETSKNWVRLKKTNYINAMRFQNRIFPEKITFDGEKFGTDNLSMVYKMNQQSGAKKSQLVTLQRIEL